MVEIIDIESLSLAFENVEKKCKYCIHHCHIENPEEIQDCINFQFKSYDKIKEFNISISNQPFLLCVLRKKKSFGGIK
jgi:hypothetical protein